MLIAGCLQLSPLISRTREACWIDRRVLPPTIPTPRSVYFIVSVQNLTSLAIDRFYFSLPALCPRTSDRPPGSEKTMTQR